ncbi:hypothetical protein JK211_14485 [Tatumella sp. JGM130]|uniref:hypothetical protein n=1 Tax=Tatumella sp. JGM130 TaxID=2799797 RepID=UPI001BB0A91E|nr:hypothetical protein [Tatumella sp. JGM130]MBS0895222.1 hypothetical protein [Tatumella sp. JGM130]
MTDKKISDFNHDDILSFVKGGFFKEEKEKEKEKKVHEEKPKKTITYELTDDKKIELFGVLGSRGFKKEDLIQMNLKILPSTNKRLEQYNEKNKPKAITLLLEYALDMLEKEGKGIVGFIKE